jgi:hypothetical protein
VAPATASYQPRATEQGVLHAVIRRHLERFLAEASGCGAGTGLPAFVEREFLQFLTCGVLAHGFGRIDGWTGTLTVIQRFRGGLDLNVHSHTLALDGVFTEREPGGPLVFHAAPPPSDAEVGRLVITVRRRVLRLLDRRGYGRDPEGAGDPLAEESPVLAGLTSASALGQVALGRRAGAAAGSGAGRAVDCLDGPAPRPSRRLRLTWAKPISSSTASPFMRRAVRNAAICALVAAPDMIASIAAAASIRVRSREPRPGHRRAPGTPGRARRAGRSPGG